MKTIRTSEKQVSDVHAVYVQTKKSCPVVTGVSMTVNNSFPSMSSTELIFTLNELKRMVKECEKI